MVVLSFLAAVVLVVVQVVVAVVGAVVGVLLGVVHSPWVEVRALLVWGDLLLPALCYLQTRNSKLHVTAVTGQYHIWNS